MIKAHGFCIFSKPRNLRYYFVTELSQTDRGKLSLPQCSDNNNNNNDSSLLDDSASKLSFDSDIELIKESGNLFNKVRLA
jgi:hypothetical protein